jgi:hypothetical protein
MKWTLFLTFSLLLCLAAYVAGQPNCYDLYSDCVEADCNKRCGKGYTGEGWRCARSCWNQGQGDSCYCAADKCTTDKVGCTSTEFTQACCGPWPTNSDYCGSVSYGLCPCEVSGVKKLCPV